MNTKEKLIQLLWDHNYIQFPLENNQAWGDCACGWKNETSPPNKEVYHRAHVADEILKLFENEKIN